MSSAVMMTAFTTATATDHLPPSCHPTPPLSRHPLLLLLR